MGDDSEKLLLSSKAGGASGRQETPNDQGKQQSQSTPKDEDASQVIPLFVQWERAIQGSRAVQNDADFGYVQGFVEGLEAGAAVVTTLGDMLLAVFHADSLAEPIYPEGVSWDDFARDSFRSGYFIKICCAVLAAPATKPDRRFECVRVGGNGKCMYWASSKVSGSDPDEEHGVSTKFIARNWHNPCPVGLAWRMQGRRTFGEAAAAEHQRAFAGPSDYLAYMNTPVDGQYPWSSMVEAYAHASVTGAVFEVFSLDGGALAVSAVFYPQDGPKPGSVPISVLHGKHGEGGVHFDGLRPAADGALAISASAWETARHAAVGAAIARLAREGRLQLASDNVGGAARLEALARASIRAEVVCAMTEGGPGRMSRDEAESTAEWFVAMEVEGRSAVELLNELPRLRNAVTASLAPRPPLPPAARLTAEAAAGPAAAAVSTAAAGMMRRHRDSRSLPEVGQASSLNPAPVQPRSLLRTSHATPYAHGRLHGPSADRSARPAGACTRSAPSGEPGPTACRCGIDTDAQICSAAENSQGGCERPFAPP